MPKFALLISYGSLVAIFIRIFIDSTEFYKNDKIFSLLCMIASFVIMMSLSFYCGYLFMEVVNG